MRHNGTYKTRRVVPLHWTQDSGDDEAAAALGLMVDGWSAIEIDAVRRLWQLREEWARFVPGYESVKL